MLLQFDATVIFIAISFIIFAFIMQALFYGPIAKIRKDRQAYIDNKNKAAAADLQQAEDLKSQHEAEIANARLIASKQVANSTNEANKEKNISLQETSIEISQKINAAKEEINKDKANVKSSLKSDVIALANMITTKILGEDVPGTGFSNEIIDNILK